MLIDWIHFLADLQSKGRELVLINFLELFVFWILFIITLLKIFYAILN